ncbi:MAG: hypothetical protein FWE16_00930 [Firmicutes bacterium]|nr:hypothetical protein [Bacillota bacterium]
MIKALLDYQEKEKEKLNIIATVEGGKVKRELDEAMRIFENAKNASLALDEESKQLVSTVETLKKENATAVKSMEALVKGANNATDEEKINEQISEVSKLFNKVAGMETQLGDIIRKINDKNAKFEIEVANLKKSQGAIKTLQEQYAKQKEKTDEMIKPIDAALKKLEPSVDAKLLEKYKKARLSSRARAGDVVIRLVGNNCGACHFEIPLSMIHKITTDGYISCEECGKIIYKA